MKTELFEKIEAFRKEIVKIMPGYKWTVKKPSSSDVGYLEAVGTKSSGKVRISTLLIIRNERDGWGTRVNYTVKSSGYGLSSLWIATKTELTLARALRDLQNHYEYMAREYSAAADHLKAARRAA